MRIGYFADGAWAHKALEKIVDSGDIEICFIVPRYDMQDPVLKNWAKKLHVPFLPIENVNDLESIKTLKNHDADLFVSMSFNQILKSDIIHAAHMGFINCHAGALPFYRGRNPLNWVLINDEKAFGITVHYVDLGIDTGDIIHQDFFAINDSDDYSTLLQSAYDGCADVLYKSLVALKNNQVNVTQQKDIHAVGFYCGQRRAGDELINWRQSSRSLFNFIRAITRPGPGARAVLDNKEVAIVKSEMIADAPNYIGTIGEVVGRNERGVVVKTLDSTIRLLEVADVLDNGELADSRVPKYRIGTRFKLSAV